MTDFKSTKSRLTSASLKATQQRMIILNFVEGSKNHPTAEVIYEQVRKNNPSLSLATIYSTLETFVNNGLINKVLVKDGAMRYDAHTEAHNHIYCSNTNEIIDFEDQELQELIEVLLKKKHLENLNIKDISLHIQGDKIDKRKGIKINH